MRGLPCSDFMDHWRTTILLPMFAIAVFGGLWFTASILESSLDMFSDPDLGTAGFRGDTFSWQGGEVGVCDYSSFPGNYKNSVEWHGPNDEFKVLVWVGDTIPEIAILPSGWVEIRYRTYDSANDEFESVIVKVKDLDSAAVSTTQGESR